MRSAGLRDLGHVVVLWRGPVRVEIHLDENYNVKAAYVRS